MRLLQRRVPRMSSKALSSSPHTTSLHRRLALEATQRLGQHIGRDVGRNATAHRCVNDQTSAAETLSPKPCQKP
jgi:hypothetical protein